MCTLFILEDCSDGDVRLQQGPGIFNGRVELCLNGMWGLVCATKWDNADASVVCRQLGYDTQGMQKHLSDLPFLCS